MKYQIHVYYGFGKGKTTACTGLAIRALGAGKKVTIVYFDKGHRNENEHYSERKILRQLNGCTIIPTGCERVMEDGSFRFGNTDTDYNEAMRGLNIAKSLIESGDQDILILDEILAAVLTKLITKEDVMSFIDLYKKNPRCELILSGHKVWKELTDIADLVTEVKKHKHYYDLGVKARLGIDY